MQGFPFQPEQASTIARSVDHLYYFITAVTLFFTAVIFLIIFYLMIKYRRRSPDERPKAIEGSLPLENSVDGHPHADRCDHFRVELQSVLPEFGAAQRLDGDLRHWQAVDVEDRASRGAARNQRIARAAWTPG